MDQLPLGTEKGFGPGDIVLDGDPASIPAAQKGGTAPPLFGPYVLWRNGWMPLGTEVGLGPGHVVLAPPKRSTAPQFSAHVYRIQTVTYLG